MRRASCLLLLALVSCGAARAPEAEVAVVTLATASPAARAASPAARAAPEPPARAPAPAEDAPGDAAERGPAPKGTLRLGRASAVPELADMAAVLVSLRPRLLRCVDRIARRDGGLAAPLV